MYHLYHGLVNFYGFSMVRTRGRSFFSSALLFVLQRLNSESHEWNGIINLLTLRKLGTRNFMEKDEIQLVDIDRQMREAYLDYAMSVIVSRALPDARDGLKPVHRRILFAMHDMGIRASGAHKKSARIVGEVLGKYHPHGDSSIYDAMARMAQDFSMRYTLVNGQGNFGSIDGDSPAAMRYTEAKLEKITEEILADIDKETIDFTDNFDGTLKEPTVMPTKIPLLLLNGSAGIAVGMATNVPPHNLGELTDAIIYMIQNYDNLDEVSVDDLMKYVKGPDFPTGGIIMGRESIAQAYSTGRAKIVVRGRTHIEESRGSDRYDIIITEIPYQVNKTTLIERIAQTAREGRIDQISDLRDESDREGMRIVIELKRGSQPNQVLNLLYKHTPLQSTFGVINLALVNDQPRTLSLKRALRIFIDHRLEIVRRRSEFELRKARERAHILEGLMVALANLDDVIALIRAAKDTPTAKEQLMSRYGLTDIQAQAILDLQLRRLSALEQQKIEDELEEIRKTIAYLESVLADPKLQLGIVETETREIREKYADERRTTIDLDASEVLDDLDMIEDRSVFVSLTDRGYIKRVNSDTYRTYNRGAMGIAGHGLKEEDHALKLVHANTLDKMLFFTNRGKVYAEYVFRIAEGGRTDKGTPAINIINLEPDEKVTEMVSVQEFAPNKYLLMGTANGKVKRTPLSGFANIRSSGIIAMGMEEGDELHWAKITDGSDDVVIVSRNGKGLRFSEKKIRAMGRTGSGVRAMKLGEGDRVVSMVVCRPEDKLLIISEKGIGKRVLVSALTPHGRGTGGVRITNPRGLDIYGHIVGAIVVQDEEDVTFLSSGGNIIRLRVEKIPIQGRAARGVRVVRLAADTEIVSMVASDHDEYQADSDDSDEGSFVDMTMQPDALDAALDADADESDAEDLAESEDELDSEDGDSEDA